MATPNNNPIVFFDMTLGGEGRPRACLTLPLPGANVFKGEPLGRIKMELFANVTPKVV